MPNNNHPSAKRRLASPVKRKRPNVFVRFLQRVPGKAWWVGGFLIAAAYVWFFYYFFVSPYGFRWRALYGDISYPEGYQIHGIDISHHQGTILWDSLVEARIKGTPVRFIVMKATEGSSLVDENYYQNFRNARDNGFICGAYHFWGVKSNATSQAHYFISKVKLEEGDLPPVLDVEHKTPGLSDEQFRDSVLKWLDIVEQHYQVKPIIYTYYKFKTQYLGDSVFNQYPYWIAHYYVDEVEYDGPWMFWQHTDAGRLPGISGMVDLNIFKGSLNDLMDLCIKREE
jgi:lysozyme